LPEPVDNIAFFLVLVFISVLPQALIDTDGTIAGTLGECKGGIGLSYKGIWGYAPCPVLRRLPDSLVFHPRSTRLSEILLVDYADPAIGGVASQDPGTIVNEVVQMVRDTIGPVASFKTAAVVQRLPKTRSGKILRGTMQKIADGDLYAFYARHHR
jgi:hypothetical protein